MVQDTHKTTCTVKFDSGTALQNSARFPRGDGKLAHWAAKQLEKDAQATIEKAADSTLIALMGKLPTEKQRRKKMRCVPYGDSGFTVIYWNGEMIAAFSGLTIGINPAQADQVICRWHYRCLVTNPMTPSDEQHASRN
jgi:hypothetical protein